MNSCGCGPQNWHQKDMLKKKGIVKSTMPFVNATTHVIWDFVRDAREHKYFTWTRHNLNWWKLRQHVQGGVDFAGKLDTTHVLAPKDMCLYLRLDRLVHKLHKRDYIGCLMPK